MEFKKWLQNEARFNPSKVTKLTVFGPQQAFNLAIDNEGNVVEPERLWKQKSYITIYPRHRSGRIDLKNISPQSTEFRRIVKAIKSKYPDIENWNVEGNSHMQSANSRSRTVGYWLSRPEIRLANKMPKYFYHGTSTNIWYEGIKQKGLIPRNITGSSGSFGSGNIAFLSYDDHVYLATDPDAATRTAAKQAARQHGGKPLIIRIETTGLDPDKLEPDEDTDATTAQTSVDISSTLAYKGRIPANNIEPFLLGKKQEKNSYQYDWEKFQDVPIEEHPLTQRLKQGEAPDTGDQNYYAIKDAGLFDIVKNTSGFVKKVVKNPENITDAQVKNILKNATWTTNARIILKDIEVPHKSIMDKLTGFSLTKESLENPMIKMVVDSGIIESHEINGIIYLSKGKYDEDNAIKLAKMLGKKSFNQFKEQIQKFYMDQIEKANRDKYFIKF